MQPIRRIRLRVIKETDDVKPIQKVEPRVITMPDIDNSWSIKKITTEFPPPTWENVFLDAVNELSDISDTLEIEEKRYGPYYPLKKDLFAAFYHTRLEDVKVVLIGQDPYHQYVQLRREDGTVYGTPRATGLSFSARKGDSIPGSLQNIYKELEDSVPNFVNPKHGDLRGWATQGVLLLNTCLTVRANQAGSHGQALWSDFIKRVFAALPEAIYLLWGKNAQNLQTMLGDRNVVFTAAHPSGYSARAGFFGCNHFNLVNRNLIKRGKTPIDWNNFGIVETTNVVQKLAPVNIRSFSAFLPKDNIVTAKQPQAIIPTIREPCDDNLIPILSKGKEKDEDGTNDWVNTVDVPIPKIPQIQFGKNRY